MISLFTCLKRIRENQFSGYLEQNLLLFKIYINQKLRALSAPAFAFWINDPQSMESHVRGFISMQLRFAVPLGHYQRTINHADSKSPHARYYKPGKHEKERGRGTRAGEGTPIQLYSRDLHLLLPLHFFLLFEFLMYAYLEKIRRQRSYPCVRKWLRFSDWQ